MTPPNPAPSPDSRTVIDTAATVQSDGTAPIVAGHRTPPPIPDHELLRPIGRGSYGEVWLARNIMGTFRAVKIVYRASFEREKPFEREFTGIQKFEPISRSHSALVDILQIGRAPDCFYYVMELADDATTGQEIDPARYQPRTLRSEVVEHGRVPIERCVEIGLGLASGLQHLHGHGLIHRDIKPSNIIFVHGQPKLADIGLVAEQSEAKSFVGTEGFIPPEGPGTPAADVYSLGKVLYEMATGKDRHEFPELPSLTGTESEAGLMELNAIILKACQNEVKSRYATAEQIRQDLLLMQSGKSVKRAQVLEKRFRLLLQVSTVGILLTLVAFGAIYFFRHQAAREFEYRRAVQKGLYAADMLLAARALEDGHFGRVKELLEHYNETLELRSMRGWEWRHLWNQIRSGAAWEAQGHPRTIHSMAMSHDGRLAATGGNEGNIVIWDLEKRVRVAELPGSNVVTSLTLSRQHILAATDARSRRVRIWNLSENASAFPPIDTVSPAVCVSFAPDGSQLAIGTTNGLELWNLPSRTLVERTGAYPVAAVAWSHDGALLASADRSGVLTLRHVRPSASIRTVEHHSRHGIENLPTQLAFSPDDALLAMNGQDSWSAEIWSVGDLKLVRTLTNHLEWVSSVGFSRDGRLLATSSADQRIRLWDTSTWQQVDTLHGHLDEVWTLAFSPTADLLLSGDKLGRAFLWDTKLPQQDLSEWTPSSTSRGIALGLRGRFAVWMAADGGRVRSCELDSGIEIVLDTQPVVGRHLPALGQGDELVASLEPGGRIAICRTATGERVRTIDAGASESSPLALADTGGRLALANTAQAICIYDIGAEPSTATPHASLPTSGWRLDRLRFSPDGRLIAAALDRAYAVEIWDIEGSRKIVRLDGHRATIDAMSFFPDQCRIATASADATVRIWEVSTGRLLHTFGGQRTAFRCLAISPDGMRIAGSGGDGITRIWDPDVGREVIALRSQGEAVYGLAFDHDGSTLISCSRERVRFWPSPSFEELDAASRSRGSEGP